MIDAHKLSRYNDMYFNVSNIVGNMSDENVRDTLNDVKKPGSAQRGKLIEKMMLPYSPSFLMPEARTYRGLDSAKPIEGLNPAVAEGIMQAAEEKVITDAQWLAIKPIWQQVYATAKTYAKFSR